MEQSAENLYVDSDRVVVSTRTRSYFARAFAATAAVFAESPVRPNRMVTAEAENAAAARQTTASLVSAFAVLGVAPGKNPSRLRRPARVVDYSPGVR